MMKSEYIPTLTFTEMFLSLHKSAGIGHASPVNWKLSVSLHKLLVLPLNGKQKKDEMDLIRKYYNITEL